MSLSKMNFENLFADPVFDYIITHNALIIKISVSAGLDYPVKRRLVFSVDAVATVIEPLCNYYRADMSEIPHSEYCTQFRIIYRTDALVDLGSDFKQLVVLFVQFQVLFPYKP